MVNNKTLIHYYLAIIDCIKLSTPDIFPFVASITTFSLLRVNYHFTKVMFIHSVDMVIFINNEFYY